MARSGLDRVVRVWRAEAARWAVCNLSLPQLTSDRPRPLMYDLCCQVEKVDLRDTLDKTGEGGKRAIGRQPLGIMPCPVRYWSGDIEVSVFESFVGYL